MMCIGRRKFTSARGGLSAAEMFYGAPAWVSGQSRRRGRAAAAFDERKRWAACLIEAISKAGWSEEAAAVVRSFRPMSEAEWSGSGPEQYWGPADIDWDFAQPFAFPRTCHGQLRWEDFQLDRTRANMPLPGNFVNPGTSGLGVGREGRNRGEEKMAATEGQRKQKD